MSKLLQLRPYLYVNSRYVRAMYTENSYVIVDLGAEKFSTDKFDTEDEAMQALWSLASQCDESLNAKGTDHER